MPSGPSSVEEIGGRGQELGGQEERSEGGLVSRWGEAEFMFLTVVQMEVHGEVSVEVWVNDCLQSQDKRALVIRVVWLELLHF